LKGDRGGRPKEEDENAHLGSCVETETEEDLETKLVSTLQDDEEREGTHTDGIHLPRPVNQAENRSPNPRNASCRRQTREELVLPALPCSELSFLVDEGLLGNGEVFFFSRREGGG
jgi:hypothetical protein